MEVHWQRSVYIGQHEFIYMESMPIVKNKEIGEHERLSGNWKGADFGVCFCKRVK